MWHLVLSLFFAANTTDPKSVGPDRHATPDPVHVAAHADRRRPQPLRPGDQMRVMVQHHVDFPVPTSAQRVTRLACDADLVVLGRVIAAKSFITAARDLIFTDYEVAVLEPFKGEHAESMKPITVTIPGGEVLLDGKTTSIVRNDPPALAVGSEYVFFLERPLSSGARRLATADGILRRSADSSLVPQGLWLAGDASFGDATGVADLASASVGAICAR